MNAKNIFLGSLFLIVLVFGIWLLKSPRAPISLVSTKSDPVAQVEKFKSEEDYKDYLSMAPDFRIPITTDTMPILQKTAVSMALPTMERANSNDMTVMIPPTSDSPTPERYSQTNVQVMGIDEPDIVKTDGKELYISSSLQYVDQLVGSRNMVAPRPSGRVSLVKAFPLSDLHFDTALNVTGDLLLDGTNLVVINKQSGTPSLLAYDVKNPHMPVATWKHELKNNSQIVASRLLGGKIYLVTRTQVNRTNPCPIVPLVARGQEIAIDCSDIYRPIRPVVVDVTYTVFTIDIQSGEVKNNITFVGSASDTVVYMSPGALYISYFYQEEYTDFLLDFLKEDSDLLPVEIIARLNKLATYDISSESKRNEITRILNTFKSDLSPDEALQYENEFSNRFESYSKKHTRDLTKTGIVKISLTNLGIEAVGSVPGKLLNQFSLDEYQGNLRVATTVGAGQGSANDVYILNENMDEVGSIKDLGLTEKIYSARFIKDQGYLVTFRQTDPFYVLDLSNPSSPKMSGELKIPGFSSYLHPLKDGQILGVGQENGRVKLSLFDVRDPSSPKEIVKYSLNDTWSEVASNHHAFQQDARQQIFFLPGSKGGYIFSYQGNNLKLVKAISTIKARRAVYIDDYLYVIGDRAVVVLDEDTWEQVNELSL